VNRNETRARGVPTRRSLAIAMMAPAPAATPSTAAMMGCGHARIAFTSAPVRAVNWSSPFVSRSSSGPMISWTSPPEQKLPPAPVTTKACTASSAAPARKIASISA